LASNPVLKQRNRCNRVGYTRESSDGGITVFEKNERLRQTTAMQSTTLSTLEFNKQK